MSEGGGGDDIHEADSQRQAYENDISAIRKRKRDLSAAGDVEGEEEEEEENVHFPNLFQHANTASVSVTARVRGPAAGGRAVLSLHPPVVSVKKGGEHDRRTRALAQARVNGKFVKKAALAEEIRDSEEDDEDDYDEA